VHIIKNAAKTTSKGKQSGREMAKDRGGKQRTRPAAKALKSHLA